MRRLLLLLCLPALYAAGKGCVGGLPVGSFRLTVRSGAAAVPVRSINALRAGEILRYEPLKLPRESENKAQIAVMVAPAGGELVLLDPQSAAEQAEWKIAGPASAIALIYGPQGLNVKKLKSLAERNEQILSQLAYYAEQTSQVEALVTALTASEDSGGNLDAALSGFGSRFGVAMPKLDPKSSTNDQAATLFRAVLPSLNTYDPLAPRGATMQQSAGLAASIAGLFFGSSVGIAAGGASLFQNLSKVMFPDTEFRSAIVPAGDEEVLGLCAKVQKAKPHTRVAYLWAWRIPGLNMPAAALAGDAHVPMGSKSILRLRGGVVPKALERAREWRLVCGDHSIEAPVAPGPAGLEIDLTKAKAEPGEYTLAARWDFDDLAVGGKVFLHKYPDLKAAAIVPETRDRLIEGRGRVTVRLAGGDFEFVEKVAMERAGKRQPNPAEVPFTLPDGKRTGTQTSMEVEIDTARRGDYRLLITQSDGLTHELPFRVLPPNPVIENLPLRANTGEREQRIQLRGKGLDRIERLSAAGADFDLGKPGECARAVVLKLPATAKQGDSLALKMEVRGLEQAVELPRGLEIAGPRPLIESARTSGTAGVGVALLPGELAAGPVVSLALSVRNLASTPTVELGCANAADLRQKVSLAPGDRISGITLNTAGEGLLFLSLDPAVVGHPGCRLSAVVSTAAAGRSDAYDLGRVVRAPRIEQFILTDEKLGEGIYAGILKGQDLETVEKTGWDESNGLPVGSLPAPAPGQPAQQVLKVALPWPAPAPHAPVYVWLRGEARGRATGVKY